MHKIFNAEGNKRAFHVFTKFGTSRLSEISVLKNDIDKGYSVSIAIQKMDNSHNENFKSFDWINSGISDMTRRHGPRPTFNRHRVAPNAQFNPAFGTIHYQTFNRVASSIFSKSFLFQDCVVVSWELVMYQI